MIFYFNTRNSFGNKVFQSISIRFYPKHWKLHQCKTNGARKGVKEDKCYDLNIYILGLFLGYTNYDYNWKYRITKQDIRNFKLNKLLGK